MILTILTKCTHMYGFALLFVNKEAGSRRGSGRIILELNTKLRKLPRLVKAIYGELVMVAHLGNSVNDNSKEENIEEHDPVLTLSKFQVMRVYVPLSLGWARDQANQFSRG